ncbi:isochorismatase family cysteine hydrolase [Microbacterium sp. NPDC089189]|uniref:cysteine hydrolase family protein n=1 Tax=Microbacterium sp. NPDC089189 TaxID=3154972 RepID=UPI00341518DA
MSDAPVVDDRTALLVVDLQAVTLSNARTLPADELIAAVSSLLAAFRGWGLPVWHAVSTGTPGGRTSYSTGSRVWDDAQAAVVPHVAPLEGEPIVRRAAWSAFAGTDLARRLRDAGVETLVIVGLATPFGIESTARSAYDLGFSVIVPSDAVAGPDPVAHEATLARTIPLLGRTTTVAALLAAPTVSTPEENP